MLVSKTSDEGSIPSRPADRGVAQLVAHLLREQGVAGSNPVAPTIGSWLRLVERLVGGQEVGGSSPPGPTEEIT